MSAAVPLVFLDTETTSLAPSADVWEVAMIRRDPGKDTVEELTFFIGDLDLRHADPRSLEVGRFYQRHPQYREPGASDPRPGPARTDQPRDLYSALGAARAIERMTRGAHIVGCVPSFDTEKLDRLLRRHGLLPAWHHHLIDVESMAVGWLNGEVEYPWHSYELSEACGVDRPPRNRQHTALGDARWVRRWYDRLVSAPSRPEPVEVTFEDDLARAAVAS